MGLFDFFSGGKGGSVKKLVAKANNKHAQSVDRWKAMEGLRDDGTDEALAGLLRRFTFNYDKTIEDEQEKQWVHDTLVEMGREGEVKRRTVLAALEHALVRSDTISWPLKVLEHVVEDDHDRAWPILEKVLAANDNEYVRDPSRKVQLIDFLGEWRDPRAARALLQYLEDVDETVRFHTVEALVHQKDEETARAPLLQLLLKPEEESRRIKIRILDALADLGWSTHGFKGAIEKLCQDLGTGHAIDNKGRVRKR